MKPLRLATGVEEEIRSSARWYDEQRAGLGAEFREAVERLLEEIARAPESYAPSSVGAGDLVFRQAFLRRFPYKIVSLEREREVLILACAHTRRRPGYWLGRFSSE
ncbi:MAG: hypothetical protein M9894_21205 [Planctomycetes bacterium]|nr:hypothetical protein [Planctomycetota bacterium]